MHDCPIQYWISSTSHLTLNHLSVTGLNWTELQSEDVQLAIKFVGDNTQTKIKYSVVLFTKNGSEEFLSCACV